jgi:hypothetical protein
MIIGRTHVQSYGTPVFTLDMRTWLCPDVLFDDALNQAPWNRIGNIIAQVQEIILETMGIILRTDLDDLGEPGIFFMVHTVNHFQKLNHVTSRYLVVRYIVQLSNKILLYEKHIENIRSETLLFRRNSYIKEHWRHLQQ